jgi:predicted RNA-binding protein YlxR (DUF448 family)
MRLVAVREAPGAAVAVYDERGTMPGRGAYLCRAEQGSQPDGECLAKALRRSAIGRALRCSVAVAPERLESVTQ